MFKSHRLLTIAAEYSRVARQTIMKHLKGVHRKLYKKGYLYAITLETVQSRRILSCHLAFPPQQPRLPSWDKTRTPESTTVLSLVTGQGSHVC